MREMAATLVTKQEMEELDKRKVDWTALKSTILTLTKQNIRGYVEQEAEHIKERVMVEVKAVFAVDPAMRADMIEVTNGGVCGSDWQ